MGEFKGTPGPWWLKAGDATGFKTHSGGASVLANARPDDAFFVMKIAEMATNVRESEREANARLIAAAPCLLDVAIIAEGLIGYMLDARGDNGRIELDVSETFDLADHLATIRQVLSSATGSEAK